MTRELFNKLKNFLFGSKRMAELEEIRIQMEFWHRQENETFQEMTNCLDRKDFAGYDKARVQWELAKFRCQKEVGDKLNLFSMKNT